MDSQKLFWLLLAIVFLFWLGLALNGFGVVGNDAGEHLMMAKDGSYSSAYAPLFRWFSAPFATQETMWSCFSIFVLIIPACVLLFLITKEKLVPLFYFCLSSFFYLFMAGLFTQLLVFVFVLALFYFKNQYLRLGIILVGILVHTQAYVLLPIAWLFILLEENKELLISYYKKAVKSKWVLGSLVGCSPFWGRIAPDSVKQVVYQAPYYIGHSLSVNDFFSFFTKIVPFPFLFVALNYFWEKKRIDWLLLFVFGFVGGFVYGSRVWYLCALVMMVGFCFAWKKLEHKRWWGLVVIAWGVFLFEQFIALRLWC